MDFWSDHHPYLTNTTNTVKDLHTIGTGDVLLCKYGDKPTPRMFFVLEGFKRGGYISCIDMAKVSRDEFLEGIVSHLDTHLTPDAFYETYLKGSRICKVYDAYRTLDPRRIQHPRVATYEVSGKAAIPDDDHNIHTPLTIQSVKDHEL